MVPAACLLCQPLFHLPMAAMQEAQPYSSRGTKQPGQTITIFKSPLIQDSAILFTAHGWEITLACISVVFLTTARHIIGMWLPETHWDPVLTPAHGVL